MLDLPDHVDVPRLLARGLVAQALERNPDLDFVPPLGHAAARLEHIVGAQVGLLASHQGAADEAAWQLLAPSISAPPACTPSGLTANISAWRPSWKGPMRIWMLSSPKIRSRLASVA